MARRIVRMDQNAHEQHLAEPYLATCARRSHDIDHACGPKHIIQQNLPDDRCGGTNEIVVLLIQAPSASKETPPQWVTKPRGRTPGTMPCAKQATLHSLGTGDITETNHALNKPCASPSSSQQRFALRNKVPRKASRRCAMAASRNARSRTLCGRATPQARLPRTPLEIPPIRHRSAINLRKT